MQELGDIGTDGLEELIDNMSANLAEDYLNDLRLQWKERSVGYEAELLGFKDRLKTQWAGPLNDLHLLLEVCRDKGSEFHVAHMKSQLKRNRHRNNALVGLHIRACQASAEILCLLEGGFGAGAATAIIYLRKQRLGGTGIGTGRRYRD